MILVVDDDTDIRDLVVAILTLEGYEVTEARDGAQALSVIAQTTPDLIFLDMHMPVLDGWGFVAAYRALPGPHAAIIVMTAATNSKQLAAQVSAEGCLPKPFEIRELLTIAAAFNKPPKGELVLQPGSDGRPAVPQGQVLLGP